MQTFLGECELCWWEDVEIFVSLGEMKQAHFFCLKSIHSLKQPLDFKTQLEANSRKNSFCYVCLGNEGLLWSCFHCKKTIAHLFCVKEMSFLVKLGKKMAFICPPCIQIFSEKSSLIPEFVWKQIPSALFFNQPLLSALLQDFHRFNDVKPILTEGFTFETKPPLAVKQEIEEI